MSAARMPLPSWSLPRAGHSCEALLVWRVIVYGEVAEKSKGKRRNLSGSEWLALDHTETLAHA
jgi:hypothetical protein